MSGRNLSLKPCLSRLVERIDRGNPSQRADAFGQLLGLLIPALPARLRDGPILTAGWSQPFVANAWWTRTWERLGVETLGDLAAVGADLAATRGVGKGKLLALVEDLAAMANSPEVTARGSRRPPPERIRQAWAAIAAGAPTPPPRQTRELFQAIVDALPEEVRAWELRHLPWSLEWCYTTRLWEELGVRTVAELPGSAAGLVRSRGIGKGKILMIAEELIFLSPELHARIRPDEAPGGAAGPRARTVVAAIDRLADGLSERDRDVLRRRLGWRHERPTAKLRELAEAHGVTQERIRQIEAQIRRRLLRLLRSCQHLDRLRAAVQARPGPVPLDELTTGGPAEFAGLLDVWRLLAELLRTEGGPYLFRERRAGGRVFIAAAPEDAPPGDRPAPRPSEAEDAPPVTASALA